MLDLLLVCFFCALGVLTGIATGLLPGLHVNNITLIMLSLSGSIIGMFAFLQSYHISDPFIFLLIAIFIVSLSISHTFHDCIPTTFLGAPDEDTALSVLPAHSLLLEGQGYEAVALSAMGSYGAILCCFLLLYPIRFIIGSPLFFYETLRKIMFFVLLAITILMIGTEKGKLELQGLHGKTPMILGMVFAAFLFLLSGVFGLIILDFPVDSPIGLSSPVLFPALAGLFGTPTLLTSLLTKPAIPKQIVTPLEVDTKTKRSSIISVITGSLAGILVSIIPGITSSTGTIIAMNARGESEARQTIVTLSSVNTACAFFVVIILYVILRSRSGATLAIMDLIPIEGWSSLLMPASLLYFMIALLLAGTLSYFLTLKMGRIFAKHFDKAPYQLLVGATIALVVVLVYLFTGPFGVLILGVATAIGLLPVEWGVRRSHCMGVLLLPIMLFFL
jgi:putative membrane protein